MALSKTKTLPNGITASYWRISQIVMNKKVCLVTYHLDLFFDSSQIKSLGCEKKVMFKLTEEELLGDLTAIGYNKIKEIIDDNTINMNPMVSVFKELQGYEDV